MYDLVIRGATVVDGTGSAPRRADVAVKDSRIAAIGEFGKGFAEWFPGWSHTTIVVAAKKTDAIYPPPDLTDLIY